MEFSLRKGTLNVPPNIEFKIENIYNFHPGEIIGVYGKNGVGKTTLFKYILRELNKNSICDLLKIPNTCKIGYLPQDPSDLILPWLKGKTIKKLWNKYLQKNDSDRFISDAINLDINTSKLSNGQRQILALNLLLTIKNNLIFLDEPFSSLDESHANLYVKEIKKYCNTNKSVAFVILHDPLLLQFLSDWFLLFNINDNKIKIIKNYSQLTESDLSEFRINSEVYSMCLKETSIGGVT